MNLYELPGKNSNLRQRPRYDDIRYTPTNR